MTVLPRLRVHLALGWALRVHRDGDWWWFLASTGRPDSRRTDEGVHRPGWRELHVTDPGDDADRDEKARPE